MKDIGGKKKKLYGSLQVKHWCNIMRHHLNSKPYNLFDIALLRSLKFFKGPKVGNLVKEKKLKTHVKLKLGI
jgi:hypothetical protein